MKKFLLIILLAGCTKKESKHVEFKNEETNKYTVNTNEAIIYDSSTNESLNIMTNAERLITLPPEIKPTSYVLKVYNTNLSMIIGIQYDGNVVYDTNNVNQATKEFWNVMSLYLKDFLPCATNESAQTK